MTPRRISSSQALAGLALTLFFLALGLALAGAAFALVLETDNSYSPFRSWDDAAVDIVLGTAFALVGGLITSRQQANAVGWARSSSRASAFSSSRSRASTAKWP